MQVDKFTQGRQGRGIGDARREAKDCKVPASRASQRSSNQVCAAWFPAYVAARPLGTSPPAACRLAARRLTAPPTHCPSSSLRIVPFNSLCAWPGPQTSRKPQRTLECAYPRIVEGSPPRDARGCRPKHGPVGFERLPAGRQIILPIISVVRGWACSFLPTCRVCHWALMVTPGDIDPSHEWTVSPCLCTSIQTDPFSHNMSRWAGGQCLPGARASGRFPSLPTAHWPAGPACASDAHSPPRGDTFLLLATLLRFHGPQSRLVRQRRKLGSSRLNSSLGTRPAIRLW